ncbi:mucin-6-like [Atheta coriaria]|uniref:mucin-6-like n=1 Tax=Dalotia coriaria TaxID=877792 RepID=UPI0031F3EA1D
MQTARCFIIAIVFCLVSGDPIVIDQTSEKYQTICTKQNTEFKQLCTPQPTCSEPAWVPSKCIEGCLCKDGFVLNPMGDCIPPETCPGVICPQNTTFSMCANVCEKNCMTQYLTPEYACRCSPGCECLEGFVRDRTSFCIRPEDCDPEIVKCPENQVYNKCKSSVDTCTGPILYKKCTSGCFCEDGWVLDDNNNCVLKENCPKQEIEEQDCPRNQTFKDCSLCGRSCETQYINIMFKCACQPGCACQDGYIWKNNNEKQCVKPEDCTREDTKCQSTQYYSDSEVRKTCLKPSGNGIKTSGCFCNDGLVYDEDTRTCMKPEKCPNAQCGS